jgi:dipeptidyl-peptidase-4
MKKLPAVLALILLWPTATLQGQAAKKPLTVELVTKEGMLISPGISAVAWRPGGKQITYIRRKGSGKEAVRTLYLYGVESGKEQALLASAGDKDKLNLDSYHWSPNGNALLLHGQNDLWLVDVQTGEKRRLTEDREEEEGATFSPQGDRIAFVKQNDLYAIELKTGLVKRLTYDGSDNILNGKLDWVYEEELAYRSTGGAYEWSPDGKMLAYLRLDDAPVPLYPLTDYLAVHVGLLSQRFPQAGDPNPKPSVHAVSAEEGKSQAWTYALHDASVEYVGPVFSWTHDSKALCFLTLNRAQNELKVRAWEPVSGDDRQLLVENDPYWINSLDPPQFLEDGQHFLWLSERDGWIHLYLYGRDGKLEKQLTRGNWLLDHPAFSDVPMFQVDEKAGQVYFAATERDPRERQIYRVRTDGSGFQRLTQECGTHSFNLSPDGRFIIDTFSDFNTPPRTRLLKADGTFVAMLDAPENRLNEYALGTTDLIEVKAGDGATLYARLVKPADFNPKKKYPVVIDVYGGPHAQVVQNRWGVTSLFDHLLAQEGFLVWSLDNRGSWARGHPWEAVVFKNMGQRELEDQLAGVAYLKSLPYVDANRLAIWGWSYGGYMTLYSLTHAPEVFRCGAAGGPVTAWKFYDSIYTERYMGMPAENPEGYKRASPLEAADKLKAKLLLIHGADDDNVHMQNTMNFLSALVQAGRPFELYIQPGEKHGFRAEASRRFLDERLLEFFKQCQ